MNKISRTAKQISSTRQENDQPSASMMGAEYNRAEADRKITLLHNIALLGEVQRLSNELMAVSPPSYASALAESINTELLHGGWAGRQRFAKRALRGLVWRLFRIRIFTQLAPAAEYGPSRATALPHQFARIGGLSGWRTLTPAAAQRQPPCDDAQHAAHARAEAQEHWVRFAESRPDLPYLRHLRPHKNASGSLRVLVLLGGGGLGDALLFSAMLAELRARLAPCEIVLFFEKGVVEALYEGSPHVTCAVSGHWGMLQDTLQAMRWAGIFDLVVDIYCFLPRYLVCERSRIDMDRHGMWLEGNRQLADIIDRFSSNHGMALLDRACGIHVFDLLGAVAGLPLRADSPLAFSPDPAALATVRALALPQDYVTVRDGANPGDLAAARAMGTARATKQLPQAKWDEICADLRAQGLAIIQVGDKGDTELAGADLDLRGQTGLSALCFIMKGAVAHIDTEGGLVHFARASNRTSIVFFGPTSDSFFGYPANLNLSSPQCGHCWYSSASWVARCPVQPDGIACGMDIDLAPMRAKLAALQAARRNPLFEAARVTLVGEQPGEGALAARLADWACAEAGRARVQDGDMRAGLATRWRDAAAGRAIIEIAPLDGGLRPVPGTLPAIGSIHNMPVHDGSYDILLCADILADLREQGWAVRELGRLLRPGGELIIAAPLASIAMPGLLDLAALLGCLVEATGLPVPKAGQLAGEATALLEQAGPEGRICAYSVLRRAAG